jgi:hypothetical protein
MKPYKEKNHTNPDPINIICSISLIHFFYSIIIANARVELNPAFGFLLERIVTPRESARKGTLFFVLLRSFP